MLPASWQAICAAMQRREAVGANRQNGMTPEDFAAISAARFPCATCGGRMLPPGLELITQEEAEQMARTTKRGICELCGAHTNVGMNHGSRACPACTHVQTALNKRPEAVANAIRAMGKVEDLLGYLIPAGGLAVKVTADLLQEISGLVGYDGEDPGELVEAARKRLLFCASCDYEDDLQRIADVIGYTGPAGDGLVEAVRALIVTPVAVPDCTECDAANALLEIAELVGKRGASSGLVVGAVQELVERAATLSATGDFLRDDLLRACGLEMDDTEDGDGWDVAAAAAIQTIAEMINRRDDLLALLTKERADNARLTLAEKARDEWESRAVAAERNVETLEAELRNREDAPAAPCASTTYLLDIALRALRGEGPDANQLATLIDAARRAA
jgi:hypothetical protein